MAMEGREDVAMRSDEIMHVVFKADKTTHRSECVCLTLCVCVSSDTHLIR